MTNLTKEEAITKSKEFRKRLDALLQEMKDHKAHMLYPMPPECPHFAEDGSEAIAQHTLSIRDLESAIMRLGMALKYIGNPTPYPSSKLTVEDIADQMYTAYCEAVGGKAWNGDTLPTWDEFSADSLKAKQIQGWLAAASVHPALLRVEKTADGLKM